MSGKDSDDDERDKEEKRDKGKDDLKEEVEVFLDSNPKVDEGAANDLRNCAVEVQRIVLSRGDLTSARNPSAALIARIRDARTSVAGGSHIPGSAAGVDHLAVEEFVRINNVDESAAASLRGSPPDVIRTVLARGELTGARNPSSALLSRIRDAKINPMPNGPPPGPHFMPPMPGMPPHPHMAPPPGAYPYGGYGMPPPGYGQYPPYGQAGYGGYNMYGYPGYPGYGMPPPAGEYGGHNYGMDGTHQQMPALPAPGDKPRKHEKEKEKVGRRKRARSTSSSKSSESASSSSSSSSSRSRRKRKRGRGRRK